MSAAVYPPAKVDEKKYRENYDRIFGKKKGVSDFAKEMKAQGDRWHDHIAEYGTSVSFEKCEEWVELMGKCYAYAQEEYATCPVSEITNTGE